MRITGEIVNPLIVLVFLLAVVAFGWGMVMYLAAQGSDDKVQKGKKIMWFGIIGMFILASMWGVVFLLCDFFETCVRTRFFPNFPTGIIAPPPPGPSTCNPPAIPPCFCDGDGNYHCPEEFPDNPDNPVTLTVQEQIACLNSPSICEPCRHFLDEGNPRAYVRCVKNRLGF